MAIGEISGQWLWLRTRMLEGTFPGDQTTGVWPVNSNRVHKGWGAALKEDWPETANEHWPPAIPSRLDALAKKNRWDMFQRCTNIDECKYVIAVRKLSVQLAIEITPDWHSPPNGQIPPPQKADVISGSHAISLIGYDDKTRFFNFRNSWGPAWGNAGYGRLPYEYFDTRLIEAKAYLPNLSRGLPRKRGIVDLTPAPESLFPNTRFHQYEIYDSDSDEMIAWSFTTEYNNSCIVEELYVRPDYRRSGYGTRLLKRIHGLSTRLGKPHQFHITYADIDKDNINYFATMLQKYDYVVKTSKLRWAPLVGVKRKKKEVFNLTPQVAYIPEKPATVRQKLAALVASVVLTEAIGVPPPVDSQEGTASATCMRSIDDWDIQNERRIYLLGLKYSTGLSQPEIAELAGLQAESLKRIQEAFPISNEDRNKLGELQGFLAKLREGESAQ